MNRLDLLFQQKKHPLLNVFCTAGFPERESLPIVLQSLEQNGADLAEIGMPYSDPLADGPIIQQSNMVALDKGMNMHLLFEQLADIRTRVHMPLVLMGYLNPVLQFGMEAFCRKAAESGIDGIILPDLPIYEFETQYQQLFQQYGLRFIFLVTPETSEERIRHIDRLSSGFIYAVSSSTTTGNNQAISNQEVYFKKLEDMQLKNPVLVGFGIHNRASFLTASSHAQGAIIGSAYIKALKENPDVASTTKDFLNRILGKAV